MAYLVRRSPDRIEIRESHATPRGPRSLTLASFKGTLTPEVLDRARERAARPFDRAALLRRARAAGIAVADRSHEPEARALLARLRRSDAIDPVLAGLLREALARVGTTPPPEPLAEVSEWIGAGPAERGAALHDLLDLYGRIAEARSPVRARAAEPFPRIASRVADTASHAITDTVTDTVPDTATNAATDGAPGRRKPRAAAKRR